MRYRANSTISEITGFDSIFRGHLEAIVLEERNKIEGTNLIDSILVKLNQNGPKEKSPIYLGHSSFNFDCITKATKADYDPLSS